MQAGRFGDIGERAVVVAIEPVGVAVHVAGIKIEVAVFVVIEPEGTDGLARVRKADRRRNVSEHSFLVPEEDVRTIAEADEEIEIVVAVEIDPRGLPYGAGGNLQARRQRDVDEPGGAVPIEREDRSGAGGEANEEIGLAIEVEVSPRRGSNGTRFSDGRGDSEIAECTALVQEQPVGRAVETNEQVGCAVVVDVGRGVDERTRCNGVPIRLEPGRLLAAAGEYRGRDEQSVESHVRIITAGRGAQCAERAVHPSGLNHSGAAPAAASSAGTNVRSSSATIAAM